MQADMRKKFSRRSFAIVFALATGLVVISSTDVSAVSSGCATSVRPAVMKWAREWGGPKQTVFCEMMRDGNVIGDSAAERIVLVSDGNPDAETGDIPAFVVVLSKSAKSWKVVASEMYGTEGTSGHRIVKVQPGVVHVRESDQYTSKVNISLPN
jgi:hypothetical protein